MMISIDRFTERAQEIPIRAAEIMQRYNHNQLDTEHVLLAMMEQPQGIVPRLLEYLKVDANALAGRLDAILRTSPQGETVSVGEGQISITPRVAQLIELANEEANRQKEQISTEHLFLAIFHERGTPSARLLEEAGLTSDRVSDAIQQIGG